MPNAVEILTFAEAAGRLRMSVPSARWHHRNGDFPRTFRIGRRLMVRETDLRAVVDEKLEQAS